MRNASWNCSPNPSSFDSKLMSSNMTEEIGVVLQQCKNNGNCVAFELTDVSGNIQKGHRCECLDGFRYVI